MAHPEHVVPLMVSFGKDYTVRMRVQPTLTVFQLTFKLRRYFRVKPEESIFIFINGGLYAQSQMMGVIAEKHRKGWAGWVRESKVQPLKVVVTLENTFGGFSKLFVRASVTKKKSLYVTRIVWSWYGLQHYSEMEVFNTLQEANQHILQRRTSGCLVYADDDAKDAAEVGKAES
jgi:hypothetical protein